jgi:hypothetical protein
MDGELGLGYTCQPQKSEDQVAGPGAACIVVVPKAHRASGGALTGAVRTVAAGADSTCALDTRGRVLCWGSGMKLGNSLGSDTNYPRPMLVGSETGLVALTSWSEVPYGLKKDGSEWFYAAMPRLTWHRRKAAQAVRALGVPRADCRVTSTELLCGGGNKYGQLGLGDRKHRFGQFSVPGLRGVTQVAVGRHHTCAVTRAGALLCRGRNQHGQQVPLGAAFRSGPLARALQRSRRALRSAAVFGRRSARVGWAVTP